MKINKELILGYLKDYLTGMGKTAPATIYQSGIIASLISTDAKYVVFSVLALIFGDGFNFIAKKYTS